MPKQIAGRPPAGSTHSEWCALWSLATDDPLTSSDGTSSPARSPSFVSRIFILVRSVRALLPQRGHARQRRPQGRCAPTGSLVDSACSCVFTARDGSTSAYRVARVRLIATSLAQALGLFGSRAARLLAAIPGGRGFSCFLTRLCALAGRARKEALTGWAHFCVRARPLAQPSVQDNVRQPVGQRPMEPPRRWCWK